MNTFTIAIDFMVLAFVVVATINFVTGLVDLYKVTWQQAIAPDPALQEEPVPETVNKLQLALAIVSTPAHQTQEWQQAPDQLAQTFASVPASLETPMEDPWLTTADITTPTCCCHATAAIAPIPPIFFRGHYRTDCFTQSTRYALTDPRMLAVLFCQEMRGTLLLLAPAQEVVEQPVTVVVAKTKATKKAKAKTPAEKKAATKRSKPKSTEIDANFTDSTPTRFAKMSAEQLRNECTAKGIRWRNAHGSKHLSKAEMIIALTA